MLYVFRTLQQMRLYAPHALDRRWSILSFHVRRGHSENFQGKDDDAGNVLHFRSSRTQYCEFAVAKSEQKKLKRSIRNLQYL